MRPRSSPAASRATQKNTSPRDLGGDFYSGVQPFRVIFNGSAGQNFSRADLDDWVIHLDRMGVPSGKITDRTEPFTYSTLVFRDPDNIQMELIWLGRA